jgi:hypothetical protein
MITPATQPFRSSFQPTSSPLKGNTMIENTSMHQLEGAAKPIAESLDRMNALAHDGVAKVMDSSHQLRELAHKASQTTLTTIRDEPVKYALIAAATGAALMALITLVARSGHRH